MHFELDNALTDQIVFYMENQHGKFMLDSKEAAVIDLLNHDYNEEPDFSDTERFIPLPDWCSNDGYRLMETFTSKLKNPIIRYELSSALNKSRKVFRSFRNVLDQYPEQLKMWFKFKKQRMTDKVIAWYNALREQWGLDPLGIEPEDNSSLILEDFVLREGNASDLEDAQALHNICVEQKKDNVAYAVYLDMNPFAFPGDFSFVAESASGEFSGFICAVKHDSYLQIRNLEVKPEYRALGLGKTLLSKLIEKTQDCGLCTTIDLPIAADYFKRDLNLENFKSSVRRFVLYT